MDTGLFQALGTATVRTPVFIPNTTPEVGRTVNEDSLDSVPVGAVNNSKGPVIVAV